MSTPHTKDRAHIGIAGRIARAFIDSKLTPLVIIASLLLGAAAIILLPREEDWPEPFGRTIVEAMMAGLVVIGSNVGGSREIFRHYDKKMLFEPEDAQGLSDRIARLLSDPELSRRLVNVGRKLASERFTIQQMTNGIEAFLKQVGPAGSP